MPLKRPEYREVHAAAGGVGSLLVQWARAIGRDSLDRSIAALAIRGHLVSFGQASGPIGEKDIGSMASKPLTLSRPNYGHYTATRSQMQM
ncbi:hypothetical protein PZ897_16725 [Hoeflea sp. YIM 152468]|uniref:hypothetical protein n=1 Tax=Hoeflea sp. YIM 152468 TaxID=3031759 RepID=UPI0023D98CA8|nr:hypothetical protein [Hoeflea sp. YIM 152468]MDF1609834.1 hypothetical protein [Hoeflea sp. YIM 152468]